MNKNVVYILATAIALLVVAASLRNDREPNPAALPASGPVPATLDTPPAPSQAPSPVTASPASSSTADDVPSGAEVSGEAANPDAKSKSVEQPPEIPPSEGQR